MLTTGAKKFSKLQRSVRRRFASPNPLLIRLTRRAFCVKGKTITPALTFLNQPKPVAGRISKTTTLQTEDQITAKTCPFRYSRSRECFVR